MKTIEIYCNYGVLAAEKRNVYTFGAPHATATCSDKMTIVAPDGWELYQNEMGRTMVTAPWGWDYDINEVLTDIKGRAAFRALDKDMRYKTEFLFTPEEIEEKEERRKKTMKKIDDAIENKMMETGRMGTETVTVKIQLTAEEREQFLSCDKYDSSNYFWEFEGNNLLISYTEEVEG